MEGRSTKRRKRNEKSNSAYFFSATQIKNLIDLPDDILLRVLQLICMPSKTVNNRLVREMETIVEISLTCRQLYNLVNDAYFKIIESIDLIPANLNHVRKWYDKKLTSYTCSSLSTLVIKSTFNLRSLKMTQFESSLNFEHFLQTLSDCNCLEYLSFHDSEVINIKCVALLSTLSKLNGLEIFNPSLPIVSFLGKKDYMPNIQHLSLQQIQKRFTYLIPDMIERRYSRDPYEQNQNSTIKNLVTLKLSFYNGFVHTGTPAELFNLFSNNVANMNHFNFSSFFKDLKYVSIENFSLPWDNSKSNRISKLLTKFRKLSANISKRRYEGIEQFKKVYMEVRDIQGGWKHNDFVIIGCNDSNLNEDAEIYHIITQKGANLDLTKNQESIKRCNTLVISDIYYENIEISAYIADKETYCKRLHYLNPKIEKVVWHIVDKVYFRLSLAALIAEMLKTFKGLKCLEITAQDHTVLDIIMPCCSNIQILEVKVPCLFDVPDGMKKHNFLIRLLDHIYVYCDNIKHLYIHIHDHFLMNDKSNDVQKERVLKKVQLLEEKFPTLDVDCVRDYIV